MAKAHISKPDGTTIVIEGTPKEVAEVMEKLQGGNAAAAAAQSPDRKKGRPKKAKASLPDILVSLADGGFFKQPKDLTAVKMALAELGEVYPVTTIAPALLRLTKRRQLRRIRQDSRWFYTG
jgi:predicted transcriptional regulator